LNVINKLKKRKMTKKCIYCKKELDDSSVIDVCERCGIGVWGEKMFKAIVKNMENSLAAGDLFQGSITTNKEKDLELKRKNL